MGQEPVKIFYCYAHEDKALCERLASHLEYLRQDGLIVTWYDREISPGEDWLRETYLHLDTSDIVLALVSPDFMKSTYCNDIEMKRARERQIIGSTRIIPVILRHIQWKNSVLGRLQALPERGKPVMDWRPPDRGFQDVARGIEIVVKELVETMSSRNRAASIRYRNRGIDFLDLASKDPNYYEEALQAFQEALRINPDSLISWVGIAYTLVHLEKLEDALLACDHVLQEHDHRDEEDETDIGYSVVLYYKHHIFLRLGRYQEAENVIKEAREQFEMTAYQVKYFGPSPDPKTKRHLPCLARDGTDIHINSCETSYMDGIDHE